MAKKAQQVSSDLTKDETTPNNQIDNSLKPEADKIDESENEEEDGDIEDYEEEKEEPQDKYVEDLLFNKKVKPKKAQATRRTHRYLKK